MQQLGIPGASIAFIDGGKVVYEGGFGVRELVQTDNGTPFHKNVAVADRQLPKTTWSYAALLPRRLFV
jgi:hypothetical protein